jgi:large subunit ribosomal protein L18
MKDKSIRFEFRKNRVRERIKNRSVLGERPRLSVHRSLKYIYAQVLDDKDGKTLAYASSLSKEVRGKLKSHANIQAAKAVGELIAIKAKEAGVKKVAFDRGGHLYHGRIKALAEAARSAGLEF